ncbi:hypothetical protein CSKR_103989 [Clonorchis sinensis]|uniref:Uncharacterized protein n=1 Tax=Clonorchis sinensis TaxID=79923 RepID=A0A419QAG7_CLOSI|nr:hypothetical protein CSKR_103989 [Clonorchis sinensis]
MQSSGSNQGSRDFFSSRSSLISADSPGLEATKVSVYSVEVVYFAVLRNAVLPDKNLISIAMNHSPASGCKSMCCPPVKTTVFGQIHSFAYRCCFEGRLTWSPAGSLVYDVFKQLNVLHQTASCFRWHDIQDIAIHLLDYFAVLRNAVLPDKNLISIAMNHSPASGCKSMCCPPVKTTVFGQIHSFAYRCCFEGRLTWSPAGSLVYDVFKQLNVLHQTASCFRWHDIQDIAIHLLDAYLMGPKKDEIGRELSNFQQPYE